MRGRKPLATEVHQQSGAYRNHPSRENKQAPKPKKCTPDVPANVLNMPIAKATWDRACKILAECNVLTANDGFLLESFCVNEQLYDDALKQIRAMGITEPDGRKNQVVAEFHKFASRRDKLLSEFGLTPSSRTRLIATPTEDEEDPFGELMARMRS